LCPAPAQGAEIRIEQIATPPAGYLQSNRDSHQIYLLR
jgi:hypothetical protein